MKPSVLGQPGLTMQAEMIEALGADLLIRASAGDQLSVMPARRWLPASPDSK